MATTADKIADAWANAPAADRRMVEEKWNHASPVQKQIWESQAQEAIAEHDMVTSNVALKDIPVSALHGFLNPNDPVAISFWIISISMVAATVFFLMESTAMDTHWKTSMNVGSLVTLVAGVHYFYMREFWVQMNQSPILYRYIDWSITVPLQMIEFYLILSAVQPNLSQGIFYRLLLGTVAMLTFGYCGEAGFMQAWPGFILGMAGWGFILYEIFAGEAGQVAASGQRVDQYVKQSFATMRFIVTVGWSIYPLGYFFGYLCNNAISESPLNLIYNLADFVNKIAFCLAIWHAARSSTLAHRDGLSASLLRK